MKKFVKILFIVVYYSTYNSLSANNDINYFFRHITVEDGLAHTDLTSIIQDRDGFIWFGTTRGLQRFDGTDLELFRNDESNLMAVYNNRIRKLNIDQNGLIWVATEGGLKIFDTSINSFVKILPNNDESSAIVSQECLQVLVGKEGAVYIINAKGLFRLDMEYNVLKSYVSLFEKDLRKIYTADMDFENGNLWATLSDDLIYVPNQSLKMRNGGVPFQVIDENGKSHGLTESIGLSGDKIFFGIQNGVLETSSVLSRDNQTIEAKFHQLSYNPTMDKESGEFLIHDIQPDNQGNLWLASNRGLYQMLPNSDGFTFKLFDHSEFDKNSLTANHISNLFLDNSSNLWIGTYSGGCNYVDLEQRQFSLLRRDPSQPNNTMLQSFARAICMDGNGNLWLGTKSSGISIYNPNNGVYTQITRHQNKGLIDDNIRSLCLDRKNRMWIGLESGLCVYDPKTETFEVISRKTGDFGSPISEMNFFSIKEDMFGNIWAGSWNNQGVLLITYRSKDDYDIRQLNADNGLCSDRITSIYADKEKPEILISTNKGLNHIYIDDNAQIIHNYRYVGYENDSTSLNSNFIWQVARSSDSILWVGTLGGGLNKLELLGGGRYMAVQFGPEQGVPSIDIESLLLDDSGNIWMGGRGLSMLNTKTEAIVNYDHNDGLQGNSFKIGSAYKAKDGSMYFGGINGVTFFHPEKIIKNESIPRVALTDLYVNGSRIFPGKSHRGHNVLSTTINSTNELDFTYEENNFTISFASLDYKSPEKIRYRYKLEGYDKDWIVIDGRGERSATYSNLEYDSYIFKVVASKNDGAWSSEVASIGINVNPPIWNTLLARIFYGFLGIFAIALAFLFQRRWYHLKQDLELSILEERKMEEMHQMRLKFFTNISHEFKTPLTLIISPIERLMSNTLSVEEQHRVHSVIYNNANRLLSLINELMDFRKVETQAYNLKVANQSIQVVLENILSGFEEMASNKKLKFKYKIDLQEVRDLWFDKGVVEKLILNLISNAFRYTNDGSILVEASTDSSLLESTLANKYMVGEGDPKFKKIYIKVTDTGIGITKASISNIFDRYYRISDGDAKHLGSGVGLALVKSLAMIHHGDVIVHSERNVGSEFIITLSRGIEAYSEKEIVPVEEVEELQHTIAGESFIENDALVEETFDEEDDSLPKILIVEDNEELLSFLKDCFSINFNVLEAHNGEEGLELVHEKNPEIIISDIMMPVMDGITFCQTVKSDINYSHIPLILLSAKSGDETKIEGTEVGADAYFSKPFNLILLQKTVNNMMESRRILKERYKNDTFVEEREMVNNRKDKEFMDRLIEIINAKMDDPAFDIDHLCLEIGNSRTKLYNKIKGLTGLSVGEFIRRLRLKKSAEILLKDDLSVSEVMIRVGIQSQSYFTKTFKKEFGVTPAQYSKSKFTEEGAEG